VKRAEGRKWLNREVEMDVLPLYPGSLRGGCWRLGGVPGCVWTDDRGAVISDNGTYRDGCGFWDDFEGSIVYGGPLERESGSPILEIDG